MLDAKEYRGLIELALADVEPDGPPRIRKEFLPPAAVWVNDRPPRFFEIVNLGEL